MTSIRLYKLLTDHVAKMNTLAAKLRDEKIEKLPARAVAIEAADELKKELGG